LFGRHLDCLYALRVEEAFVMKMKLFLMLIVIMIAACSKGSHDRQKTNSEEFMKGQFVPLHTAPSNHSTDPGTASSK
jgi:hypothetical protein